MQADVDYLLGLSREDIESTFQVSGKQGKDGITFIGKGPNGHEFAMKLFRKRKAIKPIQREVDLQEMAAAERVAPRVYGFNPDTKFIVMEKMSENIVQWKRRLHGDAKITLNEDIQAQLYALMLRLDKAAVLQNDGNPLNLMFNENMRLFVIDYGLSKKIKKTQLNKFGPYVNLDLGLWSFEMNLKKYGVAMPKIKQIYREYRTDPQNYVIDSKFRRRGEALLIQRDVSPSSPVIAKGYPLGLKSPPAAMGFVPNSSAAGNTGFAMSTGAGGIVSGSFTDPAATVKKKAAPKKKAATPKSIIDEESIRFTFERYLIGRKGRKEKSFKGELIGLLKNGLYEIEYKTKDASGKKVKTRAQISKYQMTPAPKDKAMAVLVIQNIIGLLNGDIQVPSGKVFWNKFAGLLTTSALRPYMGAQIGTTSLVDFVLMLPKKPTDTAMKSFLSNKSDVTMWLQFLYVLAKNYLDINLMLTIGTSGI